jgi:catechol 2,3-dioxygenase-like lactoylglutathione lyase family enzyme
MSVPAQLNIVTLGVSDLPQSVAFYQRLGWEKASSSMEEIAWFRLSGCYLGLFPYEELAADAKLEASPRPPFGGFTLAMNVASPKDVELALGAARRAGATIIKPGTKMDWGGYSGYFTDPDGYPWEVAHNPNFPINEDGTITIP